MIDFNPVGYLCPRWTYLFKKFPESFKGKVLLDLGCGQGSLGFMIRHNYIDDGIHIIGVDQYKPYIDALLGMNIYDEVYYADMSEYSQKDVEVDYSFFLEVLEHDEKHNSKLTLERIISKTREKVFITIPNQGKTYLSKFPNPFMNHASSWQVEDFEKYDAEITIFDSRIGLTKILRYVDDIRRNVFNIDKSRSKHILASIDGQA